MGGVQLHDARRRLDGGRAAGQLREDGARRRPAADGRAALDPIVVDDDTLAFDAIAEVGPGGHFFGTAHTQARYRTAFYRPLISDWRNYETWEEAGSPEAAQKANQLVKLFLARVQSRRSTMDDGRAARSSKPSSTAGRRRRRPQSIY